MIYEKINLKQEFNMLENDVVLTTYCPDNFKEISLDRTREALLVLPGGGYFFLSERESEPVALKFLGYDIAVFVLEYTIASKIKYPYPLVDVYAALAYIRKNASKYHINCNSISLLGFSAGGHLAASCSAYHTEQFYADFLGVDLKEIKVNGCILSYPVISTDQLIGHEESTHYITQDKDDLKKKFSIDKVVNESFPKTFIWHTTFDTIVPLKNSLLLAEALTEKKIFFEMHVYPMHDHGQSLATRSVYSDNTSKEMLDDILYNSQWVSDAVHFIKNYI